MTARKGFKAYLMPLIVLLMVCMLLGSMSLGVKANAASENKKQELEISSSTITSYFMHINLKNVKVYPLGFFKAPNNLGFWGHERTFFDKTIILEFKGMEYVDKISGVKSNLICTFNTTMSFSGMVGLDRHGLFEGDTFDEKTKVGDGKITVNIQETFFNYLIHLGQKFEKVTFKMLWSDSDTYLLYSKDVNAGVVDISKEENFIHNNLDITLEKGPEVSTDPNDPSNPGPGGGGGTIIPPGGGWSPNVSFLENSYNFVKNLFGWTLTYEGLKKIVIGVLLVIGGVLAISGLIFLIKIIVRIFRK